MGDLGLGMSSFYSAAISTILTRRLKMKATQTALTLKMNETKWNDDDIQNITRVQAMWRGCHQRRQLLLRLEEEERQRIARRKKVTLLVVGLQDTGKSTLVNVLCGNPQAAVASTNGFELNKLLRGDYNVQFFGLGGSPKIRDYWCDYYDEVHAMIFVVDASAPAMLEEAAQEFKRAQSDFRMEGKPVLIFANKQDL